MNDREREVLDTVEALNRCWTAGDPAGLRDYFHRDMVAITPGDRLPLVGGAACVAAWNGYAAAVRILAWRTREERVHLHGDTAVVTYLYEMVGEQDGRRLEPAGRDMIVLVREGGRWWVVADQFSSYPAGGPGRGEP